METTSKFKSSYVKVDWGDMVLVPMQTSTGTIYYMQPKSLGEFHEQKKQSETNKCSVQKPTRETNRRYLNRPSEGL
jgi:hypothetical protein